MDIEDALHETLTELLNALEVPFSKITINEGEKDDFSVNIESDDQSILIGHHGANIHALQHLLKVLAWKKCKNEQFNIMLDVDEYRKRQEENVMQLAERKVEAARSTGRPQKLPPMSPYFRRKVHMLCMGAGFEDIETYSQGEGDHRHLIIKLK